MDFALECERCGASEDLEADSLNDTHRPACARCGGKLRRTGSRPPRKSPVAPPDAPAREVDDLRIDEPFPTGAEPKDAEGYLWRGHARAASGDLSGAVADAVRAVDLDPFLAPAWLLRGALRLRQGDRDGAAVDLETFLRLAPEHPHAERTRGKLMELRGGRGAS